MPHPLSSRPGGDSLDVAFAAHLHAIVTSVGSADAAVAAVSADDAAGPAEMPSPFPAIVDSDPSSRDGIHLLFESVAVSPLFICGLATRDGHQAVAESHQGSADEMSSKPPDDGWAEATDKRIDSRPPGVEDAGGALELPRLQQVRVGADCQGQGQQCHGSRDRCRPKRCILNPSLRLVSAVHVAAP